MEKKNECDIVRDLVKSYNNKIIAESSKKIVDAHIKDCNNCKKYYNLINERFSNESKKDKIEIDFLKKIRKKFNILKLILIIICIVIISVVVCGIVRYQKNEKIIDKSYERIETIKKLENYQLIQKTIYIDYEQNNSKEIITNYYYKNGKYKINCANITSYFEDDSANVIYIYDDLKQIDFCKQNMIVQEKGKIFDIFSEIISYKRELRGLYKLIPIIRKERFNGIDCYVIRNGNDNSYRDVWIDRDNYNVLRVVNEEYTKYYNETLYTLIENNVTEEDVNSSIIESEKYKEYDKKDVVQIPNEEFKKSYEALN